MSPKNKNTANGVITFHTPFPESLLKSEGRMADLQESRKHPSQPSVKAGNANKRGRSKENDEALNSGLLQRPKQDGLSHACLRRLQVKMEAEKQQARDIIQPLLDTENAFVKEVESFLKRRDVAELRRRELLHKRWTERVWLPLQKQVEERASTCGSKETKRRQSLYSHYLHHCNKKGFVFLETYDLEEYNPFFLSFKKSHYYKLSAAHSKDTSYLQSSERQREKRMARSREAGCKYSSRQEDKLPPNINKRLLALSESVMPEADILQRVSSSYPASLSQRTPAEDETEQRKSSRLDTIPYHIGATATPDGRCHETGCWFSTGGC